MYNIATLKLAILGSVHLALNVDALFSSVDSYGRGLMFACRTINLIVMMIIMMMTVYDLYSIEYLYMHVCMYMDVCTCVWMKEWINVWMERWMNESIMIRACIYACVSSVHVWMHVCLYAMYAVLPTWNSSEQMYTLACKVQRSTNKDWHQLRHT